MLLALLDAFPPLPAGEPSPPLPGLADALGAWAAIPGAQEGLTAAEGLALASARPALWRDFCEAAAGVVGGGRRRALLDAAGGGGQLSTRVVGEALRAMRGRSAGGWRLLGTMTREGVRRWRVERV